jgi:anti-sigma regulatory factor (Ser/Thr protein kinase)
MAPAAARRAIEALSGRVADDVIPDVKLLVSELITNSVKYGGEGALRLQIETEGPRKLRAEVIDQGVGFVPVARDGGRRLGSSSRADALQALGRPRGFDARVVRDRPLTREGPALRRALRGTRPLS